MIDAVFDGEARVAAREACVRRSGGLPRPPMVLARSRACPHQSRVNRHHPSRGRQCDVARGAGVAVRYGPRSPKSRVPARYARLTVSLEQFSPRTRDWFKAAFTAPTPAQSQAWPAIASGEHVLISAPTGSGKTLAAFLWAIDRLASRPSSGWRGGPGRCGGIGLVYVSPLKALSYDIDRNLRVPLRGIGADLKVAVRTGDTPQRERQAMLREPPDILITTPESLYLMLTGRAQELFAGTESCIVDEIHAVASTKRGAHLALTLERLTAAAGREVQRIGLSATQKPLEEIGRFLVGPTRDVPDRRHRDPQGARPPDHGAGRVDGRARCHARSGPRSARRRLRGDAPVDLAGDLSRAGRARQRASLDDPVRQQPPRGRAARAAAERAGRARDRARPPRLSGARGAARRRGDAEGRRAAVPGGHLIARARDRHGRRRPRDSGRVAQIGGARTAADRPGRPLGRRRQPRPHLPEVPRRPARVCGRRAPDAGRRDRDHRGPAERARRARAADRGDRGRRARGPAGSGRRPPRAGHADALVRGAQPHPARERARHARRPLSELGVLGAASADRVGSREGHDPGSAGCPATRGDQRRHDPRPRSVLGDAARRPARRRARRGDGVRGPSGPDVPARGEHLADRGDRPRPRDRHAGAGPPGRRPVLEGRRHRPSEGARGSDRRLLPLGRRATGRGSREQVRPGRASREQPDRVPARAAAGDARGPVRPGDRGRAIPRRDRGLAPLCIEPLRRAGPRGVGAGAERANPRPARARVRRDLVGRRDHRPSARRRGAAWAGLY